MVNARRENARKFLGELYVRWSGKAAWGKGNVSRNQSDRNTEIPQKKKKKKKKGKVSKRKSSCLMFLAMINCDRRKLS